MTQESNKDRTGTQQVYSNIVKYERELELHIRIDHGGQNYVLAINAIILK